MKKRYHKFLLSLLCSIFFSHGPLLAKTTTAISTTISVEDSLELVTLWTALDGPNWTNNTWDLQSPVSTWDGIVLNSDNSLVLAIYLQDILTTNVTLPNISIASLKELILYFESQIGNNNSLRGAIPDFSLPALEYLDLSNNELDGSIPDFTGMPNLEKLILHNNNLSEFIPNFSNLPNLEWLDISSNEMSGTIPIFDLPALEYLNLSYNNTSGTIPNFDLPALRMLWIIDGNLIGPIPNFTALPNLKELNLSENPFNTPIPNFSNLLNLEKLDISDCGLIGEIPNFNLPMLERIELHDNMLTGQVPNFDLPALTSLILYDNQLSGTLPLFNLPNLEVLYLYENQISGAIPTMVLPSLRRLELQQNQLSGAIPNFDFPNLQQLNLSGNLLVGEIPNFNMSLLTELRLSFNQLQGSIPNFDLPALELLELQVNADLTGSIPDFNLPQLQFLYLRGCNLIGTLPDLQQTNLQEVQVDSNVLTGELPDFSQHEGLTSFTFSNNQFSGCYPLWLCTLSSFVYTSFNPGLPDGGSAATYVAFCQNPGSQYGRSCDDGDPNTTGEIIQPDCSCSTENSFTNFVSGKLFMDTLENCSYDVEELPLENWLIIANNNLTNHYAVTDSLGCFKIYTDTGQYNLQTILPNDYWFLCSGFQDTSFYFSNATDSLSINLPLQAEFYCPVMEVDIGTAITRICGTPTYTLSYINQGTALAEDAYVEITFDDSLSVLSSVPPWDSQDGQTYTFEVGDVDIAQGGTIDIAVEVSCEMEIGQSICVEAHMYPDSICFPPDPLWDGASIDLLGKCEGDSVKFLIKNIGTTDMTSPLGYVIIEDDLILRSGTYMLPAGGVDSTTVDATGATYRLEAQQSPYHPTATIPAVFVEACTNNNSPISTGFVNMFPMDDADPFVAIDCRSIIAAYDPNDKHGFPLGLGEEHIIAADTDIEYQVRFQNTGNDTAFLVVVKDLLDVAFDPTTIKMGASSHTYEWTLQPGGLLEVRFPNIMLPDSNINESASHGFFKYKIKQLSDNPPGTLINNEAAIYFDYNDPILTNKTTHLIETAPSVYDTLYDQYCAHWFYDQDTTWNLYGSFDYLNLYQITYITTSEQPITYIDSLITQGQSYQDIVYYNDTTLVIHTPLTEGCDSLTYVNLSILTAIAPIHFNTELQLYPNPAGENVILMFDLSESEQVEAIKIYDQMGQQIRNHTLNQMLLAGRTVLPLSVEDLEKGLYFICVEGEERTNRWTAPLFKR